MRHIAHFACSACLALAATGCAGLSLPFVGGGSGIVRPTKANPVMDILTIWESGEGRGLDDRPSRGLAGQLMFFTYRAAAPALVEGDVTVYLFDDQGTEAEQSTPLWQHSFTTDEWNSFAVQTNLGTAYQLFVPYVRKGQHEAHCTVRIKFEPDDGGPPVYSKMADITLPGPKSHKSASTLRHERIEPQPLDPSLVHRVGQADGPQTFSSRRGMQTTTLPVPGKQRGISAETKARLQQLTHEMVQEQQVRSGVQQAGYQVDPAAAMPADDAEEPADGGRYRLYR